jgi:hypothetical protein
MHMFLLIAKDVLVEMLDKDSKPPAMLEQLLQMTAQAKLRVDN